MINELKKLSNLYGIQLIPPVPVDLREEAFSALEMPEPLRQFYSMTNGIAHEWFRIPPISDPDRIKQTRNNIQKINDPDSSKYLAGGAQFLQRFIVFAELSGPDYAVFDRGRGTIWGSEGDDLYETDQDLLEFISTALREVEALSGYKKPSIAGSGPHSLKKPSAGKKKPGALPPKYKKNVRKKYRISNPGIILTILMVIPLIVLFFLKDIFPQNDFVQKYFSGMPQLAFIIMYSAAAFFTERKLFQKGKRKEKTNRAR